MSSPSGFLALTIGAGLVTLFVAALLEGRGYLVVEWMRRRLSE